MDFTFPSFTRASTDLPFSQPPQKSLLELVIEAKGRLGLVPQRKPEKRLPSASFSAFSDSDEEGDEHGNASNSAADTVGSDSTAVLTTRTAWVPPSYLLDYFFSGPFMQAFLTLHGITSSRPAAMLAPPLFTVRDAQLHPVVETALCAALQEAVGSALTMTHGTRGGRDDGGRGRGGRGGYGSGGRGRGSSQYTRNHNVQDAAVLMPALSSSFSSHPPLWEVAKLEQLKDAVFGDVAGDFRLQPPPNGVVKEDRDEDAAAGDESGDVANSADAADNSLLSSHARTVVRATGSAVAQRVLFRGLQQVALPALLLGDHVLMSGPRGVGKRTALMLAAAVNALTHEYSAGSKLSKDDDEDEKRENEADHAINDAVKAEMKQEPADDSHAFNSAVYDRKNQLRDPAPRALLVLSSYTEVLAAAQWLERVFGPEAFTPYTFRKDNCILQPLFGESDRLADMNCATEQMDRHAAPAMLPTFSSSGDGALTGPAYLTPPTAVQPLPFITDTSIPKEAVAVIPDPTQADPVLIENEQNCVLGASAGPDLMELVALVQGAPIPSALLTINTNASEKEKNARDSGKRRRQRCFSSDVSSVSSSRSSRGSASHASNDRRSKRDVGRETKRRQSSVSSSGHGRRNSRSHRKYGDKDSNGSDADVDRGHRRSRHHHHRSHSSHVSEVHSNRRSCNHHRSHRNRSRSSEDGDCDDYEGRSRRHRHRSSLRDDRSNSDGDDREDAKESCGEGRNRRHQRSSHHSSSSGSRRHRGGRRYEGDAEGDGEDNRHNASNRGSRRRHHRHRDHRDRSSSSGSSDDRRKECNQNENAISALNTVNEGSAAMDAAVAASSFLPHSLTGANTDLNVDSSPIAATTLNSTGTAAKDVFLSDALTNANTLIDDMKPDHNAWLPAVLRQRIPILLTSYHALQTAMEVVGGEATALPPLENVRIAALTQLEKALTPPLKDTFSHAWWVSLVNAFDVECQFMTTADRDGAEVLGFLTSTILPDAGEHLLHLDQRDASIWALMDVQVYSVPVEAAASPGGGNGMNTIVREGNGNDHGTRERRQKISGEDIDAAKLMRVFSLIFEHMANPLVNMPEDKEVDSNAFSGVAEEEGRKNRNDVMENQAAQRKKEHPSWQGARVVVVCSNRREAQFVVTQLARLFRDQQHDARAGFIRVTDAVDAFRSNQADVFVVTDAQLSDVRILRDLHQCTQVNLILHFSLPRNVMTQLEKCEIAEVLARRGRAILGSTKLFCGRRWWHISGQQSTTTSVAPATEFAPAKVACRVMLTEHNVKGRVGTCILELLSEMNDE